LEKCAATCWYSAGICEKNNKSSYTGVSSFCKKQQQGVVAVKKLKNIYNLLQQRVLTVWMGVFLQQQSML
jgi:hypothetical protein